MVEIVTDEPSTNWDNYWIWDKPSTYYYLPIKSDEGFLPSVGIFKRPLRLGKPDLTVGSPEESHFLHQTKVATHVFFSGKDDDF